ncbi:MAG: hypothetical protein DRJ45_05580 [Thermoprotei archaeon]|nr:MAG: hypothetical protein DRJ45_05580 [Thermoprotei archaeon]
MYKSIIASIILLIFSFSLLILIFRQNIYIIYCLNYISKFINMELDQLKSIALLIIFGITIISAFILIRGTVNAIMKKVV